jgi:hypothetical protein
LPVCTASPYRHRTQAGAADSQLTINGLEITGKSNQLDGVIEGVTLTLKKVTTTPADISVGGDQDATKANLDKVRHRLHDLNKLLADQTLYDPDPRPRAALQGNAVAVRIQQQIREQMRAYVDGGASSNLSVQGFKFGGTAPCRWTAPRWLRCWRVPPACRSCLRERRGTGHPPTGIARLLEARLGSILDAGRCHRQRHRVAAHPREPDRRPAGALREPAGRHREAADPAVQRARRESVPDHQLVLGDPGPDGSEVDLAAAAWLRRGQPTGGDVAVRRHGPKARTKSVDNKRYKLVPTDARRGK